MKSRKSMTIESKLLSLLLFSASIMGVGGVIVWLGMSNLYDEVKKRADQDLSLIYTLTKIQENQLAQVVNFEQAFRSNQRYKTNELARDTFRKARFEFNERSDSVNNAIARAQELLTAQIGDTKKETERETLANVAQQLREYQEIHTGYVTKSEQAFDLVTSNQATQAEAAADSLRTLPEQLRADNTNLLQQVVDLSQNAAELAKEHQQNPVTLISLIFIVTIIINLILGLFITRNITKSLGTAVAIAEDVSAGNLTTQVEVTSHDEIGQLLAALKTMTESLNSLIFKVQQSGIQITSSTTQMAASRKQLEATLTEQIASTNEVTTTAQEIANTSEELVKTMEQVNDLVQNTGQAATKGQKDLVRMEKTMRQLADATTSISTKLGVMSEKAHNINSVVLTITKVADQTNLLSLNAAIEAEKAGEYGAGFAVVAREIRRLADQTAVATLEIEQMVKEMQSAVSTGVMEMDKFNKEVGNSVENVGNISGQIAQVIEQVQSITPRFEMVSKIMEEQSCSARHIREAMEQLSEGSEQTAYSLHDTNTVLERLDDAAQGLQTEISVFKVHA